MKEFLTEKFGYFTDARHHDNVEVLGEIPLVKHEPYARRLAFPDLSDWHLTTKKLRDNPKWRFPTMQFTYGGRESWIAGWKHDD